MYKTNTTISQAFINSLNNAFGSRKNFERELIYSSYKLLNRGKLYLKVNNLLNFKLSDSYDSDKEYILLTCNLDSCDIFNFIEDIDYIKLSNAYLEIKSLIESK